MPSSSPRPGFLTVSTEEPWLYRSPTTQTVDNIDNGDQRRRRIDGGAWIDGAGFRMPRGAQGW